MMRSVQWFEERRLLERTPFIRRLSPGYMEKARYNLTTMSILFRIGEDSGARKILDVPEWYLPSQWGVITGYYAIALAALSSLARINYRSKNHTATVVAMETFFVKKELLEGRYLDMLENVQLEKGKIEQLEIVKERREIAQYSVTKDTTRELATKTRDDAYDFVNRIDVLRDEIGSVEE
nr:hypothetical protein GZ31B6_19 [uncultured archaeon GZfos31B6]